MLRFEDVLAVLTKDKSLAKLVKNAAVKDKLMNLGFDSLDIMMLRHNLAVEYNVAVQIASDNSFEEIINQINALIEEQG